MEIEQLDIEAIIREFKELERAIARDQKIDAEPMLRRCAEIRATIPPEFLDPNRPRPSYEGRMEALLGFKAETPQDFEYFALHDGVQSLADDLREALARSREIGRKAALQIYYAALELVRDPKHAHLIPRLEALRVSYEREHGPIPPKPEE